MDVTDATFQTAVIERSRTLPVVVDFWAEWCGPCRQLGPVIERAVAARNGAIELAKIDVDANPAVARSFQIQSIPAVKAFRDGQVAAEFVGAQPPAAVDQFLDSLLPSEADELVARGDEESLRRAAELEPSRADAAVPLARLLLARGDLDGAEALVREVPGSFAADGIAARIALTREPADPDRPDLTRRLRRPRRGRVRASAGSPDRRPALGQRRQGRDPPRGHRHPGGAGRRQPARPRRPPPAGHRALLDRATTRAAHARRLRAPG